MFRHFAYLDPGTGSMIIQAIIGAIAGVSIFARKFVHGIRIKIVRLFRNNKKTPQVEPQSNEDEG